jgi:hemerythrin
MALFDWNDSFNTGIKEIDEQHKKLVSIVNELHEAMRQKKAKEVIDKSLVELMDYTVYHFSTEERAFDAYGYSGSAAHKKAHAEFVAKVRDLVERQKRGELMLSVEVFNYLVTWVQEHILGVDKKYVPELWGKAIL